MISHTYKNMPPKELELFGALVTSRLESDPMFSSIKETILIVLLLAYKAFSDAKRDYDNFGGSDRSTLRETTRLALVKELYLSSVKVEDLAKGNPEIISASGYILRKTSRPQKSQKEPAPVLTPSNFKVIDIKGKPGFVRSDWSRSIGAKTYALEKHVKGEPLWVSAGQTTNTFIELSGFAPDSVVEFRICTYGIGETKSEWSAPFGLLIT